MNELKPPDMPLTLNANFNPTSASGRESCPSFDTEETKSINSETSGRNEINVLKDGSNSMHFNVNKDLLGFIFEMCHDHEVDNHEIAVVYGVHVEYLLKMGLNKEAMDAALESDAYDTHWYKVMILF